MCRGPAGCAHGAAVDEIPRLAARLGVQAVHAAHDDEPYALDRDRQVRGRLADLGIALHTDKDHVVFERSEVLTASGTPWTHTPAEPEPAKSKKK